MQRCDALAECTEEPGRVTRRFLTEAMGAAHRRLGDWMHGAGLATEVDAAGNLIGHRQTANQERVLLIGSHLDSVPGGGKYDGVLGILIGVAVAESLRESELPFSLDVLAFSEEEGVRYSKPYLGSSAIANCFDSRWLDRVDSRGIRLDEAVRQFGGDPHRIGRAAYDPQRVLAYIEPHLEQGPVLERADSPVGVVSGIVGQSRLRVEFLGESGHAGTTPMAGRRDALVAASRFVSAVREVATRCDDLHATVGKLEVIPNAPNVIPERVELSLDVRHPRDEDRDQAVTHLLSEADRFADEEGCAFRVIERTAQSAVRVDEAMTHCLTQSIAQSGVEPLRLSSGAGHDAVIMASRFPTAMLFVRHPGGISHHPDERVEPADVAVAIRVLRDFVLRVASRVRTASPTGVSQ